MRSDQGLGTVMMVGLLSAAVAVAMTVTLAACGDDDGVATGSEGGPCYANGTCDPGLTCLSELCVDAGLCTPEDTGPCSCPQGGAGTRTCDADGNWGACDCLETCGDGICDPQESFTSCPQDCLEPACGDGHVDGDEACDDGNTDNNDACLSACEGQGDCCVPNVCGDGYVNETTDATGNALEACDDSNTDNNDACLSACEGQGDCCVPNVCGDGYVNETTDATGDALEACDDGNTAGGDACSADCGQDLTLCGNGVLDPGEGCDDGAANSDQLVDACRTDCQPARCGDGVLDTAEQCDDGNLVDGDGCTAQCLPEICGNGVIEGGEYCDGAQVANLTCADFGYSSGALACATDCGPILAGCYTCGNGTCEAPETPTSCAQDCPAMPAVDVLFVVDNSGSMAAEQAQLRAEITSFITALRDPVHGLPDLHVGVTSADLGVGPHALTYCEDSDEGRLLTGSCANPQGAPYIEDLSPTGCNITRDTNGQCIQHNCDQSHCGTGTFAVDSATGCPRCRNYTGEELEGVFDCISDLGTLGCGFEQPLEAMRLALDPATTANSGFLRPDSIVAVLFLTDEDDCSASDTDLFDPSQTDMSSPLGPLTSFRCFEFGITCDINSRTHQGLRHNCLPRADPGSLLYYIDRYASFLAGLRDPGQLVLAAIAGPVNNQEVTVGLDPYSQPEVQYSCTQGQSGGVPGIRLRALVEQLNDPADMSWAYSSICATTYTTALQSMAQEIRQRMQ